MLRVNKYILAPLYEVYVGIKKAIAKPTKRYRLVIIDDASPNVLTAYRAFEFSYHLKHIENSALFSIIDFVVGKQRYFNDYSIPDTPTFNKYKAEFVEKFMVNADTIHPLHRWTLPSADLAYITFLNNAYTLLPLLNKLQMPFVLQLYPGGGLQIVDEGIPYEKLKTVLSSPLLKHVIINQKLTYDFVLEKKLCDAAKLTYLYGGIMSTYLFGLPDKTIIYPRDKATVDICFTANKYMPKGSDKGYDIFIEMAHILAKKHNNVRFHIVGGFDENDIAIEPAVRSKFTFYGHKKSSEFSDFYKDKDIFISPSRPFLLGKGSFDGFPTTTCMEAGLNGLCIVFSDPLKQNELFRDKKDAIFLENDTLQFVNAVERLIEKPEDIYTIGNNGKRAMDPLHPDIQLKQRLDIISKFL